MDPFEFGKLAAGLSPQQLVGNSWNAAGAHVAAGKPVAGADAAIAQGRQAGMAATRQQRFGNANAVGLATSNPQGARSTRPGQHPLDVAARRARPSISPMTPNAGVVKAKAPVKRPGSDPAAMAALQKSTPVTSLQASTSPGDAGIRPRTAEGSRALAWAKLRASPEYKSRLSANRAANTAGGMWHDQGNSPASVGLNPMQIKTSAYLFGVKLAMGDVELPSVLSAGPPAGSLTGGVAAPAGKVTGGSGSMAGLSTGRSQPTVGSAPATSMPTSPIKAAAQVNGDSVSSPAATGGPAVSGTSAPPAAGSLTPTGPGDPKPAPKLSKRREAMQNFLRQSI